MVQEQEANTEDWKWVCPRCRKRLARIAVGAYCETDDLRFPLRGGIWRFLLPERATYFARFIAQYETVRRDEGWGAESPAYYRSLPFADTSGRHKDIWQIRARGFETLLSGVIDPLAQKRGRPLRVLDLGAGNGWLAYQLSRQGHQVAAVDLLTNTRDGLGAYRHYDAPFTPVQAEFDCLPIDGRQADVVLYNGALHYSTGDQQTLQEGLRVLLPGGRLVVLDSPIYHDPNSGAAMVRERRQHFTDRYRFADRPLDSVEYLTFDRLNELADQLAIEWSYLEPNYGLRWRSRPWLARLKGQREPATFLVVAGRRE